MQKMATIKFLIKAKIQKMKRSLISTAIKQAIAIDQAIEMFIKKTSRKLCIKIVVFLSLLSTLENQGETLI